VLLVAVGGAIAYSVASPADASRHPEHLSTRVVSVQTVGIIGQVGSETGDKSGFRRLADSVTGPRFDPMPPASLAQGDPQWSADTMAGGTFVFIFAPDGRCLAATGQPSHRVLALRRCDLGAEQRWQRLTTTVAPDGHLYGQYRNVSAGRCLAAVGAPTAPSGPAALVPCAKTGTARQLISLWWAA
jgi:hypothetical protein